jgi:hypothetical protein
MSVMDLGGQHGQARVQTCDGWPIAISEEIKKCGIRARQKQ